MRDVHLLFLKYLGLATYRLQQTIFVLKCNKIDHPKHFYFYFFSLHHFWLQAYVMILFHLWYYVVQVVRHLVVY
jgi:hypothetical protein